MEAAEMGMSMGQSSGMLSNSEMYLTIAYVLFAFVLLSLFVVNLKGNYGSFNMSSIISWVVITICMALLLYNIGDTMDPELVSGASACSTVTLIISACLVSM